MSVTFSIFMPVGEDKFTSQSIKSFSEKLIEDKYISHETRINAYVWTYNKEEKYWWDDFVEMSPDLPENITNLITKLPELNPKHISFGFENDKLFEAIEKKTIEFCKNTGFEVIPYIHNQFLIGLCTPECEEGGSIHGIRFSMDGWFVVDMVEKGYLEALLSIDELNNFLKIAGSFFDSDIKLDYKS
jgi:hypothetical protein